MVVKVVTSLAEFREIMSSDKISVFDFWATWCAPCRIMSPIFEKLSDTYGDTLEFYKVDVDEQPEISEEVGIRSLPTFIVFKDGGKVDSLIGANPSGLETLLTKAKTQ